MGVFKTSLTMAALLGAALIATAGVANAATITWGSVSVFDDVTDVMNTGDPVAAEAKLDPALTSLTVNGVVFTDGVSGTFADFDNNGWWNGTFLNATGDAGFDSLVSGHLWDGGADTLVTLTLTGLDVGGQYAFQYILTDDRDCCWTRTNILGDNSGGTPSAAVARGNTGQKHEGNSIIGAFTADAVTQDVTIAAAVDSSMTAYVLRQVPEPTSLALLGLALGGMTALRRRRG